MDRQETSISDQRSALEAYAIAHGYKIVGEYVDDAISGDKTDDRTEFLRMRDEASSGKFEVVLSWDQDRFGRFDPLDAGYWIYPFRQAGARLETIAQGRIDWESLQGQLLFSVEQLGKNQFLRDLSRNTVRGMLASAREGRAGTGGPSPYGYRSKEGKVWIVECEATVVRLIFRLYLAPGGSLRSVAAELNRRKIPPPNRSRKIKTKTPTKGVWRMSTVRTILEREKYTGSFVYLEKNAGNYFAAQEGEIVPRRKCDKIESTDPAVHPKMFKAIVSQKTFDRAQVKLQGSQGKTSPKSARQYPLAGLVKCGDCNGAMGGLSRSNGLIYRCRQYHATGTATCYCNTIPEAPLVSVIVRKIQEKYLSDSALARLRKALEKEQARTKPKPRDLARLRREIQALDQKIDQGANRVLDAPSDIVPTLYRKIEELRSDRERIKTEMDALTRHETRSNCKDGSEIDALKSLGEALTRAKPEESKELLASIVTKIELRYNHEKTENGRYKNTFRDGTIYVRPDAGEA